MEPLSDQLSAQDEASLRRAIQLASDAGKSGELPFGAVIADSDGGVIVEAISTEIGDADWTCHAETNAVRLAGPKFSRDRLTEATMYASSEPCAMCATAIFYLGIRRIVFGFSEPRLGLLLGGKDETAGLGLRCREVLARAAEPVTILGPCLETEAAQPHEAFWPSFLAKAPST